MEANPVSHSRTYARRLGSSLIDFGVTKGTNVAHAHNSIWNSLNFIRNAGKQSRTQGPRGRKREDPGYEVGGKTGDGGVTVIWVSPCFGYPHTQIPGEMGIPSKYGCRVFGIPRYPPGIPRTLVIWVPPLKCEWNFGNIFFKKSILPSNVVELGLRRYFYLSAFLPYARKLNCCALRCSASKVSHVWLVCKRT